MSKRRHFLQLFAATSAASILPRPASSQAYPARPVRVIVPFAPGGQTDVIARLLAQSLSERLAAQFYVDNKPGAGGNIGVGLAAQSAPDGYTLLVTDGTSLVVNPNLYDTVPYDPFKDFEPVSLAVTTTQVLVTHPSLAIQTVKDLVGLIKANPGKYSLASPGIGTPGHLTGELFRLSVGLDLVHVPFAGAGPAINSTVAGHTPIAFGSPASTVAQVTGGKLRGLAVASKARLAALPDVPTMVESGFADVECDVWLGPLVPARTPKEIVALLHREIGKIVATPEMKERLAALGFAPFAPSLEESAARLRDESDKWAKVIRATGIKAR